MNIGFDAKRAFHNNTGLGVYSRVLLGLLAKQFPENGYYLFNPKSGSLFDTSATVFHEVLPQKFFHKIFNSVWRGKWMVQDLKKMNIGLFHGLSHEIPVGIHTTGIPSIVTMHDMFPELYPKNFNPIDLKIYRTKTHYACTHATRVLAISEETKKHIVKIYGISPEKIDVIYQSYDPVFDIKESEEKKEEVRKKYNLPDSYFLHVGTIIERKNLLNICKAIHLIQDEIDIPLVVIGKGKEYKEKVQAYITRNNLSKKIMLLSDKLAETGRNTFITTEDMPAIYQSAAAFIYPSFYEGFGIPVAEGLASGVPVITSNTSCLPEAGGEAAYYVNPESADEMAAAFKNIINNPEQANSMVQKGLVQVKKFDQQVYVKNVMDMYLKTVLS
ncbi:MAG: glycosyltransferase family 4 protein [Niabella sp.]